MTLSVGIPVAVTRLAGTVLWSSPNCETTRAGCRVVLTFKRCGGVPFGGADGTWAVTCVQQMREHLLPEGQTTLRHLSPTPGESSDQVLH